MASLHDLVDAVVSDWDSFLTQFEAAANEDDVIAVDDMQSSLLDKCIKRHAPIHVVEAICKRCPSLVERVHPLIGTLPLHEACHPVKNETHGFLKVRENSMFHLFIKCLLNVYPEGATILDQENMLPLHVLLQHRPPLTLVKELVSHMDETLLLTKDSEDQTPLHVAIEHYADESVILFLIQKCEAAVKIPGKEGFLPLHTAVLQQTTMPVLKKLLNVHNGALLNRVNKQRIPSMAVAFHQDLVPQWQEGYEVPKSTFPDGTDADGTIQGPPMGLLSLKEIVDCLLMNIPPRLNVFTKTKDVTKNSDKTWGLFKGAMRPIIRAAKQCRKMCTPLATPDLDAIIKKMETAKEE